MEKITRVLLFLLTYLTTSEAYTQLYVENFNDAFLEFEFHNNSYPKSANNYDWTYYNGAMTAAFDRSYDPENSTLSKWMISPSLVLKNGDVVKFRTKQDLNNCQQANRLEVRLNARKLNAPRAVINNMSYDSTLYLPAGENSVGGFTNLLLTINPSLQKTGPQAYPSEWKEYTVTISGLASNEMYRGRIAFRYYITNAGSSHCYVPMFVPPSFNSEATPYIYTAMDLAVEGSGETREAVGAVVGLWKDAYESQAVQAAPNGSRIYVDDFQVIPGNSIFMYDNTELPVNTRAAYFDFSNVTNSNTLELGIAGNQAGCAINSTIPSSRRMRVFNSSTQAIKVKPNIQNISGGTDLGITIASMDSITLPARSYTTIEISPNINMPVGSNIYCNFWLTSSNGTIVAKAKFLSKKVSPILEAKCTPYPITLFVPANGDNVTLNLVDLNDGSAFKCGGSDGLTFKIFAKKQNYPYPNGAWDLRNTFNCDHLGINEVELRVNAQGGQASCYVKINVLPIREPDFQDNFVQTIYLGQGPNANVSTNTLTSPPIVAGCITGSAVIDGIEKLNATTLSVDQKLGVPPTLGVGKYRVSWSIKNKIDWTGYGYSILNVLDTVKPNISTLSSSKTIKFTESLFVNGTYQGEVVKSVYRGKDFFTPGYGPYDNTHQYGSFPDAGIEKYEVSTPSYNGGAWVSEIPFNCSQAGQSFPVKVKVYDRSGNFRIGNTFANIAAPTAPICKNIEVELKTNYGSPQIYINPEQILDAGLQMYVVESIILHFQEINLLVRTLG